MASASRYTLGVLRWTTVAIGLAMLLVSLLLWPVSYYYKIDARGYKGKSAVTWTMFDVHIGELYVGWPTAWQLSNVDSYRTSFKRRREPLPGTRVAPTNRWWPRLAESNLAGKPPHGLFVPLWLIVAFSLIVTGATYFNRILGLRFSLREMLCIPVAICLVATVAATAGEAVGVLAGEVVALALFGVKAMTNGPASKPAIRA